MNHLQSVDGQMTPTVRVFLDAPRAGRDDSPGLKYGLDW